MKYILIFAALLSSKAVLAQENGNFYGSFESNSQWLLDDDDLMFIAPEDQFRANNYFQLNYNLGNFTAGVQYEAYLPSALLGYSPKLDGGNNIATYYLNFKNETLDVTGGYFYEQFGSGLILRSWEDRQLGINNALKGVRVKYNPVDYFNMTGVYGNQRDGFEISEGVIQGLDANLNVSTLLKITGFGVNVGGSYVGRYQTTGSNDSIPSTVNAYAGRLDLSAGKFYGGLEAVVKDKDVLANEGILTSNRLYDGTALQANLGFSQKGLGVNATFRRLENFSFYADRLAEGNIYNEQLINYVPALTKQHDYLLTNIYVYNAQPRLVTDNFERRAGEVGTQWDIYYTFPKESFFGKYSTKLAGNFSYWAGLEATYNEDLSYEPEFIGSGPRYYRDLNLEIKNTWTPTFSSVITYVDILVDKGVTLGGPLGVQGDIHARIGVVEGTYKFGGGKALRAELQHLWSEEDRKNWAAMVLEYNLSTAFTVYVADSWNYGGEGEIHYYNVGGSYSKGRARVALNYGRQRGGLICVGGVCRFVPENNGLSANIAITF